MTAGFTLVLCFHTPTTALHTLLKFSSLTTMQYHIGMVSQYHILSSQDSADSPHRLFIPSIPTNNAAWDLVTRSLTLGIRIRNLEDIRVPETVLCCANSPGDILWVRPGSHGDW